MCRPLSWPQTMEVRPHSKGETVMKRFLPLMLGLTLAFGSVAVTFAQETKKEEDTTKKKKGKKKKSEEPKKETR
jgi:hypothetical protein